MRKVICKFLLYVALIGIFFNMFWLIHSFSSKVDNITYLDKPQPVSRIDKSYILKNNLVLIHNHYFGIFQCFDMSGNFIWGVQLPTTKNTDSTLVSYDEKQIYLWSAKTNTIYVYDDFKLISEIEDENILRKEDFYSHYPLKNITGYNSKIEWNGILTISDMKDTYIKQVNLNTITNYYTYLDAFVGVLLCAFSFWIINKTGTKE